MLSLLLPTVSEIDTAISLSSSVLTTWNISVILFVPNVLSLSYIAGECGNMTNGTCCHGAYSPKGALNCAFAKPSPVSLCHACTDQYLLCLYESSH